jgi:structural maintenance of chromosome 4
MLEKVAAAKAEMLSFEKKDVKYREDLSHLKSKEKKLNDKLTAEQKKLSEAKQSVKDLTKELEG